MITLTEHGNSPLVTMTLYDNHRLTITPPTATRTEVLTAAARHLLPGTTAAFLVTTVLITADGAVYYTPDHVPVATSRDVALPTLPPNQPPDQDPSAPPEVLTATVGTVIEQVTQGLQRAARRAQQAQDLFTQAAPATYTPAGARVTDRRRNRPEARG